MKIEHLGIIPDGNRRWAKENAVSKRYAYDLFATHICEIILSVGIKNNLGMITFYVISKENLKRDMSDVNDVLDAVKTMLSTNIIEVVDKLNARIKCIGTTSIDDEEFKKIVHHIESYSEKNTGIIINFLIGYNPFDEINQLNLNEVELSVSNLSVPKYVDLLVRTAGGPTRLSNFLPLQCGYANIEILENKFLDVDCETIIRLIEKYNNINPNYGI